MNHSKFESVLDVLEPPDTIIQTLHCSEADCDWEMHILKSHFSRCHSCGAILRCRSIGGVLAFNSGLRTKHGNHTHELFCRTCYQQMLSSRIKYQLLQ